MKYSMQLKVNVLLFQSPGVNVSVFNTIQYSDERPSALARSDARPPGMRTVADSNLTSGKHSFVAI